MICEGKFVFKTLMFRPSNTFKDGDKDIAYGDDYVLKVDELLDSGDITERKFKIAKTKKALIETLKSCSPYDEILLKFQVTLYASRTSLEVIDVATDE